METGRMKELRKRFYLEGKPWIIRVISESKTETKGVTVTTEFNSSIHSLDNVLHKIELELMTGLHYNLDNQITIKMEK